MYTISLILGLIIIFVLSARKQRSIRKKGDISVKNENYNLRRSDYGDAHYDPAYSMMSGNIYNSDD